MAWHRSGHTPLPETVITYFASAYSVLPGDRLNIQLSLYSYRLTSSGIPMIKIRRSYVRIIFMIGIPMPQRPSLYWDRVQTSMCFLVGHTHDHP